MKDEIKKIDEMLESVMELKLGEEEPNGNMVVDNYALGILSDIQQGLKKVRARLIDYNRFTGK